MANLYLGLGTNQGDRHSWLRLAIEVCEERLGRLQSSSTIHETAAWGLEDQPDFLNQCLHLTTDLPPLTCLEIVLDIEKELGRQRLVKWGPRNIDIDILFYDNLIYEDHRLSIPHPYIPARKFVLEPLTEIAGDLVHPILNKTTRELLKDLQRRD